MMDLLKRVQDLVGSFEVWPTYILRNIFVDRPNDDIYKTVCAFLKGNGVDQKTAADFLFTVSSEGTNPQRISDAMWYWYSTLEQQPGAMYYNVREGGFMCVNGSEVVEPKVSVVEIGVECMEHTNPRAWSLLKLAIKELVCDEGDEECQEFV
jgi:hypothetical protein